MHAFMYLGSAGAQSATFTFTNRWPATLSGSGTTSLAQTGLELASGANMTLYAPANWSGRMWPRTSCSTDSSGMFKCATGQLACNGAGGVPPTTLVEFTLDGAEGKDFYDISLVDGFNAPMSIIPQGGTSRCNSTGCPADVNAVCPTELQLKGPPGGRVVGCKSACQAFGKDQYCCTGAYGSPQTFKSTNHSRIFKDKCPQAYSYPYDDATSTFTCIGANYLIVFCP